jgi:hypothetical protein
MCGNVSVKRVKRLCTAGRIQFRAAVAVAERVLVGSRKQECCASHDILICGLLSSTRNRKESGWSLQDARMMRI